MRPAATGALPATALKSVVLPAPFGPITATTSPGARPSETRSRATTPPKRTVTSESSSRWAMSVGEIPVAKDRMDAGEQAREPFGEEQDDQNDEHAKS